MEISEFFKAGGIFMHVISFFGLISMVITVIKSVEIFWKKVYSTRNLNFILLFSSLSLALGLLSQITGIVQALSAIIKAADISPAIIMGGLKVSFYAPIWGLLIFMVFLTIWFILKEIIVWKKSKTN